MKKILFIINSLKCGGAERLLVDIVRSLSPSSYDVTVLTFNRTVMFEDELPREVKIVNAFDASNRLNHLCRKALSSVNLITAYYRWRIRGRVGTFDTIVSFLEGFPVRAHSYLFDRGKRHITFVHTDFMTYSDSFRQFESFDSMYEAYDRMDDIIFVSRGARDGFLKIIGNISAFKTVLENGIDIELVRLKSAQTDVTVNVFHVVTVGRVTDVKGFDIIPRIARMFKDSNKAVRFTIVGDGGSMQELVRLINEFDVAEMVILVGFQANPYPFIKSADIYISTSITEGLPLSLCEAMALGKPIVASPTVGSKELLSDGTGIIVDRTPDAFYNAINKFMDNPEEIRKYSCLSVKKAGNYDKETYMRRLTELL